MTSREKQPLGLPVMTALVVGSLIGSGIFSLPQNMAENAGAGAIVIAWTITLVGMLALTRIFQWLALHSDAAREGVYGYARRGFGDYVGFSVAWGYWISVWVTLVGYLVLVFDALASFTPFRAFGEDGALAPLVGGLLLLWGLHAFVLMGVRSAAILNVVVTLAKLLPLALFVLCAALAFELSTFRLDFWGRGTGLSLLDQLRSTMLYTVFVFLGIESATVYASRARDRQVISRSTLYGFLVTFALLVCVSLLSLGIARQSELAAMGNPSMARVMERAVGPWGSGLINLGLIVSIAGALLAWTLIAAEMLYLAARGDNNTAPQVFGRLNRRGTPANAMWLTNILVSILLIASFGSESAYNRLIQLAGAMALIPYLACAAFALRLCLAAPQRSLRLLVITSLGTLYGLWLIYAGGLRFLLLSMMLYALGTPFYLRARRERGLSAFSSPTERAVAILVSLLGGVALYLATTRLL
ncbi:MAG: basic amino acid/polyamine antiporter [Halieaceae bacterium]|nr:basic amino acid/polyamine antiporter [Halieaceae bacterium]